MVHKKGGNLCEDFLLSCRFGAAECLYVRIVCFHILIMALHPWISNRM